MSLFRGLHAEESGSTIIVLEYLLHKLKKKITESPPEDSTKPPKDISTRFCLTSFVLGFFVLIMDYQEYGWQNVRDSLSRDTDLCVKLPLGVFLLGFSA